MSKIKTTETLKSVDEFINAIASETKRNDSFRIIEILKTQTGFDPKMWGPSIIGFGKYHYKYDSGHEGDMPLAAFSPRSTGIVFYFCENFENREELLQSFGKYKTGKVCVYVKKLADINTDILEKMVSASVKQIQSIYPDKKK